MSLKQELERELKVQVKVKMGRPGALNVYADGQQIYSWQRTKRKPVVAELVGAIRELGSL